MLVASKYNVIAAARKEIVSSTTVLGRCLLSAILHLHVSLRVGTGTTTLGDKENVYAS